MGPGPVIVGPDEMIIEFDKGLLNLYFRHPHQLSHQDHEREKDFCYEASEFMRKKDIFSREDGKDEQETSGKHDKDQNSKKKGKQEGQRRMDIFQPHHRDIPEQKD